jgi:hypothetical protein
MEPTDDVPAPKTARLILALVELARMEREIHALAARASTDDDRAALRALEDCHAALLRIANRGIEQAHVPETRA